jgi:hypothetical protein
VGALALSSANHAAEKDVTEVGGWVSAKYTATPQHSAHAVLGGATVLNKDDLALGYTAADAATGTAATRSGIGGIENNFSLRAGYAYSPYTGFSLVVEPFLILTTHKLAMAEAALYDEARKGGGVEFGGMYSF